MNIPTLLIPKSATVYLNTKDTLDHALNIIREKSYTAIPVINKNGEYRGTVAEGDFLYYIIDHPDADLNKLTVRQIMRKDFNPAVRITETPERVLKQCLDRNFVPVVDDRNMYVGIVTRRVILKYLLKTNEQIRDQGV